MYALRFDGLVQYIRYKTLDEVREAYKRAVKNTLLYEYDCSVVKMDYAYCIRVIRVLSFEELK